LPLGSLFAGSHQGVCRSVLFLEASSCQPRPPGNSARKCAWARTLAGARAYLDSAGTFSVYYQSNYP